MLKPDFYLWLGDNPSHDVWDQYKDDHLDTMRYISKYLRENGYKDRGKVYPILGNHEGLPCDAFDFDSDSHQWIIDETITEWSQWFDNEGILHYN